MDRVIDRPARSLDIVDGPRSVAKTNRIDGTVRPNSAQHSEIGFVGVMIVTQVRSELLPDVVVMILIVVWVVLVCGTTQSAA